MNASRERVRVAHVITDLNVGGAELMLARLVAAMDPRIIESSVISLAPVGPVAESIRRAGVRVHEVGFDPGRLQPIKMARLVRLVRQTRPHVMQTWLYHADLAGLIAAALAHVPNVAWNVRCAELDSGDHPSSTFWLLRVLAKASRWPAAIVSNSVAGKRAHEQLGYTSRRWRIIPNGFDTDVFRPDAVAGIALRHELGTPVEALLVGLLARFHPMKDHTTFLRAAALVAAQMPDAHFVAAGRGVDDNRVLRQLVRDLRLDHVVHLLPERRDPSAFLAALDVAVSSSYGEAFPNVIGEAMACATPCVVTDVGDSAAIVDGGGVVVPPRDPDALAGGITRILKLEAETRTSLGYRGRERVIAEFSLRHVARQYEELYQELAATTTSEESSCAG